MSEPIHVLSLGAGVQSSTMALMAAKGELTVMPEFAVFADTQDEPDEVYDWLATLKRLLPFRVITATRSKLSGNLREWGQSQIPCFFKNPAGRIGIGKRQCTKHWKIVPIQKAIRQTAGLVRKHLPEGHIKQLIGISTDEVSRAKPNRERWIENLHPLIDANVSRSGCKEWLTNNGHPIPPKSACFYCPLKDNAAWAKTSENPKLWAKVLAIDSQLNTTNEFLHRSCRPMSEKPFLKESKSEEQFDLFNNECEGMCGV